MRIRNTTASREGIRGRECDHGCAEVGRLEERRCDVRIQSAGIAQGNVRWPSPSQEAEPMHVPCGVTVWGGDDDGAA